MLPRAERSCSRAPAARETQIHAQGLRSRPWELYTLGASAGEAAGRRRGDGGSAGQAEPESPRPSARTRQRAREGRPGGRPCAPRGTRPALWGWRGGRRGREPAGGPAQDSGHRSAMWDSSARQDPALRWEATSPGRAGPKSEACALLLGV